MTGLRAFPFLVIAACGAASLPLRAADRVVLVVWDGLRPDLVSQVNTPFLSGMARDGVFFAHHHPVFPSSTEVNGSAINTGDFPDHTTVLANKEYRPSLDPAAPVGTESVETIRKGDAATGGKYLPVPTLAEFLQSLGQPTAVAGTKGVALLADRRDRPELATSNLTTPDLSARNPDIPWLSPVVVQGHETPSSTAALLAPLVGPFPADITFPNVAQDTWTARALTEGLWKDGVPKFSLLWLSDPDFSQHQTAPGAPTALAALRSSDQNLGRVLNALEKKGLRDTTDVVVVSDHGFSTLARTVDVADYLTQHGLPAVRRYPPGGPQHGEILVAGQSGSAFLYVPNHDDATARRAALLLQQSDFAGVLFSRDAIPGTFPLDAIRLAGGENRPDLVVALQWSAELNRYGVPGSLTGDVGFAAGQGSHASLSRFDMHNTLVAAGPDFKRGWVDNLPSGNIDVAPTIYALLGIANPPPMDGRVLTEALRNPPADAPPLQQTEDKLTAASPAERGTWSQYLVVQKVNDTVYFDEGNGALSR